MTDTDIEELDEVEPRAHPYIDEIVTVGPWKYIVDNDMRCVGTYVAGTWVTPPVAPPLIATLGTLSGPIGVTGNIAVNMDPTTLVSANAKVKFNGVIHANSVISNGGAKITATSILLPSTPGPYPVQVVDGERVSNIMTFNVTAPAPINVSVSPTNAIYGQVITVTLTGDNYLPGCKMMTASQAGTVEYPASVSGVDTILTAAGVTVPSVGFQWNIWAKNPDGQESSGTVQGIGIGSSELDFPPDFKSATIAVIQAWVDAHPDFADEVLAIERSLQNRVTLITWLEGFISHRDEGTIP